VTVEELITALREFDPETPVVMSQDAEGNGYSGFDALDVAYVPLDWDGERTEDLFFEADVEDDDEDYDTEASKRVVVFWPL
jgi:hypothetical protein